MPQQKENLDKSSEECIVRFIDQICEGNLAEANKHFKQAIRLKFKKRIQREI